MSWFAQMCRNVGLMLHNVAHPPGSSIETHKQQVNKTVEEKRINPTTVLRRTTIEEIEIKPPHPTTSTPDPRP